MESKINEAVDSLVKRLGITKEVFYQNINIDIVISMKDDSQKIVVGIKNDEAMCFYNWFKQELDDETVTKVIYRGPWM